jgi:transcriptional regulator with XRE-family HTH domain
MVRHGSRRRSAHPRSAAPPRRLPAGACPKGTDDQKQISRIERGEVSPSVSTLSRLLAALGERLELHAVTGPRDNRSDEELRADFEQLTASERIAATATLSRTLTGLAGGGD